MSTVDVEKQRQMAFDTMEALLQKQMADAVSRAKTLKDSNKDKALAYLRLKKVWSRDLELLAEARAHPKLPPPLSIPFSSSSSCSSRLTDITLMRPRSGLKCRILTFPSTTSN